MAEVAYIGLKINEPLSDDRDQDPRQARDTDVIFNLWQRSRTH
jgi:hypothetical protein